MARIVFISLLVNFVTNFGTSSYPVHNGMSVKLNKIANRGESKSFGYLFAKVPQELTSATAHMRETLSNQYASIPELGTGCTNQITRIIFPYKLNDYNDTKTWDTANFMSIPIIKQPFTDYKILVATAPPHFKIGDDGKPVVIYVVFSDDSTMDEGGSLKVPSIYFVNKTDSKSGLDGINKNDKFNPIIIIDNNRTVTGLHSRQISKFVSFRNKKRLIPNRYKYQVDP